MKSILIITQKVDEQDDLLGFFVEWLREFSKNVAQVHVIALGVGTHNLPANVRVYSLGKERGTSRFHRLVEFYRLTRQITPQVDGVFAHMSPIFVLAVWPVAVLWRKKIILWYLHRSVTVRLKLAKYLADRVVTSTKGSLTISGEKIVALGHGIPVESFQRPENQQQSSILQILSVGRISPIKNYETLLWALDILKAEISFRARIIGKPVMAGDAEYLRVLLNKRDERKLSEVVDFVGYIPYSHIKPHYWSADIVVSLTPHGGIDKTALEAMAAGCLVLTANSAFREYFGSYGDQLIFTHGDPDDLARKLKSLINLSADQKEIIQKFLIDVVRTQHNLTALIPKIVHLYE